MKRTMKYLLTFVVAFAMVILFKPAQVCAADREVKELEVVEVADISNIDEVSTGTSSDFNTVYKFTLEKPAYVQVGMSQSMYIYASLSGVSGKVSTDPNGSNVIKNGTINAVKEGSSILCYLEAGSYYISFIALRPNNDKSEGITSASVAVQYVDRTVEASKTLAKVNEIKTGSEVVGFLSHSTHSQYYSFKLAAKSKVNVGFYANRTKDSNENTMYAVLYDSKYNEIKRVDFNKKNAVSMEITLNKGTYYVGLVDGGEYLYYGETIVKVDSTKTNLGAPKVTAYKAGTTTVSGTAEKGAEIYVVCNDDTFFTTVPSNGKYSVTTTKLVKGKSVKVYVIKEGIKSKVTTVKVN